MSHEFRKVMFTALSVALIGGIFNTFGGYQRIHVTKASFTNQWQVYSVPLMSHVEKPYLTQSEESFNSLSRVAVVLVSFSDQKIATTPKQWSRLVFSGEKQSISQYYKDSSQGQLAIVPVEETSGIAGDGIIQVKLDRQHPNNGNILTEMTYLGVFEAVKAATQYIKLEEVDHDRNRTISARELIWVVVFAGYEDLYKCDEGKASSGFSHDLSQYERIDGYLMTDFVQIGELYQEAYWHKRTSITTHGILAHEIGHVLGLPDLYDTDYSSQGAGIFSLMANGDKMYNENGKMGDQPSDLDPWSKSYLGFAEPLIITETGSYQIDSNKWGAPEILLIPTEVAGEYFLIENRYLENLDQGLDIFASPGGVLIWHIDESQIFTHLYENNVNDNVKKKGVDLEESSETPLGYSQLDDNASGEIYEPFYMKQGVSLFGEGTMPNSKLNNGKPSGVEVQVTADGYTAKLYIIIKK